MKLIAFQQMYTLKTIHNMQNKSFSVKTADEPFWLSTDKIIKLCCISALVRSITSCRLILRLSALVSHSWGA